MGYNASGKLLLFGEYLVLKGSKCLAIPVRFGQSMTVEKSNQEEIIWESYSRDEIWFAATFSSELKLLTNGDIGTSQLLLQLLRYMRLQKPTLFEKGQIFRIDADFPMEWGLGSSATLISLLAQWGGFDPFDLLDNSLIGSGYDVACATANGPIEYQKENRETHAIQLSDDIKEKLLFVYSGQKQNTSTEVLRFQECDVKKQMIDNMNQIIQKAIHANTIEAFENEMKASEELLSQVLDLDKIKQRLFSDYPYEIKSLGAWGGDFFMASYRNENEAKTYFSQKGFPIQFTFKEIIKKSND